MLRVREIREMKPEEREKRIIELNAELMRLKTMIKAGGSIDDPMRVRNIRRTIARILTVQKEEMVR